MSNFFGVNSPFSTNFNPVKTAQQSALFAAAAILIGANPASASITYTNGVPTVMTVNDLAYQIASSDGKVSRLGGLTALPTWTRTTVAYGQDGTEYAANAPRYRYGRNLLSKNISTGGDATGDTAGFMTNAAGTTLSYTTDTFWKGAGCLKVVCDGTVASQGFTEAIGQRVSAQSGLTYTASVYLKGSGTVRLRIAGGAAGAAETLINLTNTWTRYSISLTAAASVDNNLQLIVYTTTAQAVTFYADGLQLEQSAAATDWTEGGPQGAFIEDGATNLLTANQSSVETNTADFSNTGFNLAAGSTLARVTSEAWTGAASLSVAVTALNQGVMATYAATANTTYTFSVKVKAPSGSSMYVALRDPGTPSTVKVSYTASGSWDSKSVTITTGASAVSLELYVRTEDAAPSYTFYIDGLQLEQRSYATSWNLGGTTRNADLLTAPIAGLMNANKGAVSIRFKMDVVKTTDSSFLLDAGGSTNGLYLAVSTSGKLVFRAGDGTTLQGVVGTTTIAADTTYEATIQWDKVAGHMELFLNGVSEGAFSGPINPTLYSDLVYLGGFKNVAGRYLNGTLYHARFFSEMDDTEAALWTPTYRPSIWPSKQIAVLDFEGSLAYKARVADLTWSGSDIASITRTEATIAA